MGSGRFVGPAAERVTVSELLDLVRDDYRLRGRRSARRAEQACAHLADEFGGDAALDVTLTRLEAYVNARQQEDAALATVQYELAILRRGYSLAMRRQLLPFRPPFPTIRVSNARQGFFERGDFERLREQLPDPLRNVVTFAYCSGWRIPSEVLPLPWDRVDFDAGVVRLDVRGTKNDDGRTLPFDVLPELAEVLRRQRLYTDAFEATGGKRIPWVFHRAGKPIRDYAHAWRSACKRVGLAGRVPHDFRRTAVRNLERAGVPRSVAMKLTGHRTESVYLRYAIVCEADLREAITKLANLGTKRAQSEVR